MKPFFPHLETDAQRAARMNLSELTQRAIELLRKHEPDDGYYLAFSGGKDSVVCKELCKLAGVKFESWYGNTTVDPIELIRFIKKFHPDVKWNNPKISMMARVATRPSLPPTRTMRWCCSEYKENYGGAQRVRVVGVRAEESKKRANIWKEYAKWEGKGAFVCPILFWTARRVWEFIRKHNLPYCELYDEGWDRLGCVGCPLMSKKKQDKEFARWPKYEQNWKRAIIRNWENNRGKINTKTGEPKAHAKFKSGEELWNWWRSGKHSLNIFEEGCQSSLLYTNHE